MYLSRIGLSQLQDHHMRHLPFENLDILIGRPLDLSITALFDKIVGHRRGGYCFELNRLFARLLSAAGFKPVPLLVRVRLRDPVDVSTRKAPALQDMSELAPRF